jgi:hypothetical protein
MMNSIQMISHRSKEKSLILLLLVVISLVKSLEFCTSQQLIYIRDNYLAIRHHYHHHYHHNHNNRSSNSYNSSITSFHIDDSFCKRSNAYDGSWCYLGDKRVAVGYVSFSASSYCYYYH